MKQPGKNQASNRSGRIPIVLADDHPMFRHGLRDAIILGGRHEIVGEASDGERALELIQTLKPRLAVLDIDMPKMTGLQTAREVVKRKLGTDLIILTMHDDAAHFEKAMEIGVMGYILKDSAAADILACIDSVLAGKSFTSPTLSRHFMKKDHHAKQGTEAALGLSGLTATERRILKLISESRSTREIAEQLFVSAKTVSAHRSNICSKLNLHGTNALLKFALERKHRL